MELAQLRQSLSTAAQALPRRARRRLGHCLRRESLTLTSESGVQLAVTLTLPRGEGAWPGVLLCPGTNDGAAVFEGWTQPVQSGELAAMGLVVATFDPAGRGQSWGAEDYGGPEHQDNVRVVYQALLAHPSVLPARSGVVSLSLGLSMACGALARWPDQLPAAFLIDWEGPHDRRFITAEGERMVPALGHRLDDEFYWTPREAVRHVAKLRCGYLRIQSARDHAQPGPNRHALEMVAAAATGSLPWFRLNDHEVGLVPEAPRWYAGGRWSANRALVNWIRRLTQ